MLEPRVRAEGLGGGTRERLRDVLAPSGFSGRVGKVASYDAAMAMRSVHAMAGKLSALVALGVLLHADRAAADLWCAQRVVAHEWGVQIFDGAGAAVSLGGGPAPLPAWFHTEGPPNGAASTRVADLPPDTGVRKLPVLHFYAPGGATESIPLGLGVGFLQGTARVWFPQVDVSRAAAGANSAAAQSIRAALAIARTKLEPYGPRPTMPDDPTRQLQWNHLQLLAKTPGTPHAATEPWVKQARQLAGALWIVRGAEAERFVFYEATTQERVALQLARGPGWSATHREYVLTNATSEPVHDVRVSHREGATKWVAFAPDIAPGKSVTVVFAPQLPAASLEALRSRWRVAAPSPPGAAPPNETCVMRRDPAVPFERASSHRLFDAELDLMLGVWASEIFDRPGTTIVYREDIGYLDRVMPLSLFASMHHHVELNRFGLAIWQNVVLP